MTEVYRRDDLRASYPLLIGGFRHTALSQPAHFPSFRTDPCQLSIIDRGVQTYGLCRVHALVGSASYPLLIGGFRQHLHICWENQLIRVLDASSHSQRRDFSERGLSYLSNSP